MVVSFICLSIWTVFASEKNFGFWIDVEWGETDTITATKDLAIGGVDKDQEEWLVDNVVKSIINWILWLLGMIALIVVLYGWFLMLTAAWNEDTYGKWWKVIKAWAIWLVIIWLAWFALSLIFWLIVESTTWVWWAWTDT